MPTDYGHKLSAKEQEAIEFAEREAASKKYRALIDQLQQEEHAIQLGRETTTSGIVIRRPKTHHTDEERRHKQAVIALFFEGVTREALLAAGLYISTISHLFDGQAGQNDLTQRLKNANDYVYGTTCVSSATKKLLDAESAAIKDKTDILYNMEKDPSKFTFEQRQNALGEVLALAEDHDMRMCHRRQCFVHSYERVSHEEARLNQNNLLLCDSVVPVYLHRTLAGTSRGVNVKLGDQFDDNPVETIKAGDHMKGHQPHPPSPH